MDPLDNIKECWLQRNAYKTYEVDYQENFAVVLKMNTIRILLSLVTHFDRDLQLFDVKNVFLCGEIVEEIYKEVSLEKFRQE